jgi:hypothetical protein
MEKTSRAAVVAITIAIAIVQIAFTLIAYSHVNGAFEVIVVSLLGFMYLTVIQHGKDSEEAKLENLVLLSRIRAVVNGGTEDDIPDSVKEKMEKRASYAGAEFIATVGETIIAIIILWNFVKTMFFS